MCCECACCIINVFTELQTRQNYSISDESCISKLFLNVSNFWIVSNESDCSVVLVLYMWGMGYVFKGFD